MIPDQIMMYSGRLFLYLKMSEIVQKTSMQKTGLWCKIKGSSYNSFILDKIAVVPDAGSFSGDFVRDCKSFPEGVLDETQVF